MRGNREAPRASGAGTITRGRRVAFALATALALAATGCRTWRPDPVEPSEVLARLDAVEPESVGPRVAPAAARAGFDVSDGLTMREAVALAVTANPALAAKRAEVGVAAAQLVEAGLLPDPTVGWDAAGWLVERTGDSALAGLGLRWELPRPGERAARRAGACARVEEARQEVLAAEWRLAGRVGQAWLEVLAARRRLALNEELLAIVRKTHAWFVAAREAKAATALQENLAGVERAELEAERERLLLDEVAARQQLAALLGVRPGIDLVLQAEPDAFLTVPVAADADALVARAVRRRPDLAALLALHEQAEAALRLEIARQWPGLAIGTGVELELPLFSNGNAPAIRTRMREREALRRRIESAVHDLRAEVHAAVLEVRRLERQIEFVERELEPRLTESVALAKAARAVTQITPLELLTAQRQVLEARTRILDLRIEHRKARARLATLDGTGLGEGGGPGAPTKETR
jgi:outer membrane protein, heavy metal efflux system